MKRLTDAQQHGRRMRAQGRNYRGGYTRSEIRAGEHKNNTCRTRGCTRRQPELRCEEHRAPAPDADSEEEEQKPEAERSEGLAGIFAGWGADDDDDEEGEER